MRKKLDDFYNLHTEERDNLEDVMRGEKNQMKKNTIETTKQIANSVSQVFTKKILLIAIIQIFHIKQSFIYSSLLTIKCIIRLKIWHYSTHASKM
jgi:hypothetical protein